MINIYIPQIAISEVTNIYKYKNLIALIQIFILFGPFFLFFFFHFPPFGTSA